MFSTTASRQVRRGKERGGDVDAMELELRCWCYGIGTTFFPYLLPFNVFEQLPIVVTVLREISKHGFTLDPVHYVSLRRVYGQSVKQHSV